MNTLKITNVDYFNYFLADQVAILAKRLDVGGMPFHSLATYFCHAIQHGGETAEFWVAVTDKNVPVAFANWMLCGLPHVGKVVCDHIYSWKKGRTGVEATIKLLEEFQNFAERKRAPYMRALAIDDKVFRALRRNATRMGYDLVKNSFIDFNIVKKEITDERRGDESGDSHDTAAAGSLQADDPVDTENSVGGDGAGSMVGTQPAGVFADATHVR